MTALDDKAVEKAAKDALEAMTTLSEWFAQREAGNPTTNSEEALFRRVDSSAALLEEALGLIDRRTAPSAAQEAGWKVKPLEWRRPTGCDTLSKVETIVGTYRVHTYPEANGVWFWRLSDESSYSVTVKNGEAPTEEDAKAAAQADYERRVLSALSPAPKQEGFDFRAHLQRQRDWSAKTFGPGSRAKGVVDHIRKELREIEADPTDITEWIDVVILALDGAWRAGASPDQIIATLTGKQAKNEARVWPDWRTMPEDRAIEHDRSVDAPPASPEEE